MGARVAWGYPPAAPDTAAANEEPHALPQDGFFSSIKQSLRQGDEEVVRGHFDLGSPPNGHRYYCLVDPKSGRREPNGVLGDTIARPDGMTGIKSSAVSLYTCDKAEQQGFLVSSGYVLTGRAATRAKSLAPPAVQAQSQAQAQAPAPAAPTAVANAAPILAPANLSVDNVDVAGVKLGMSPDEVRSVLKSKKLRDYKEWTQSLSFGPAAKATSQPLDDGRFLNVLAAWSPPSSASAGADEFEAAGESFEVMFTPVPGKERAMAIIRSVGYLPTSAVREATLESGLIKKYGGFIGSADLPQSPTWRYQSDGSVQVGDACNRRATIGGLGGLSVAATPRENLALRKSPEEFRYQIDHCGVAVVTEDHFIANSGALREERIVTRFTVTAYSPVLGAEGAKAAALIIQAAAQRMGDAPKAKADRSPDL